MNILMIDTHSRTNAWRLGKKLLHDDEGSSCCRLVFRHFVLHTCVLYEKLLNQRCLDCIPFSKQNLTCCCSLKSICATALPSQTAASRFHCCCDTSFICVSLVQKRCGTYPTRECYQSSHVR